MRARGRRQLYVREGVLIRQKSRPWRSILQLCREDEVGLVWVAFVVLKRALAVLGERGGMIRAIGLSLGFLGCPVVLRVRYVSVRSVRALEKSG